jgi:flagellar hook-associated protein 2
VADGGTLTIGGVNVAISGPVTLQGLADAINTAGAPAAASVVRNPGGTYALMLTGRDTGLAHAFTVSGALTNSQGTALALNATNAQGASDAQVRINNVVATSDSNTFDGVIPNLTFTALKADPQNAVTVTITASTDSVKALIDKLVSSFNDVNAFLDAQTTAAGKGETSSIGRDGLVRGMRAALSNVLTSRYAGGAFQTLSEAGFSFERSGELSFKASAFDSAVASGKVDVQTLVRGASGTGGAFGTLVSTIQQYTAAGGLVPNARQRLDEQVAKVAQRIGEMELRLAVRREALQREFTAADLAIQQLNASKSQLSAIGAQFGSF